MIAAPVRHALPSGFLSAALGVLVTAAVIRDLIWHFPIPQRRVQVNLRARGELAPAVGAFIYGFSLGLGVLTFIAFAAFIVLVLMLAAAPEFVSALALGGAFGFGRASLVWIVGFVAPSPQRSEGFVNAMASHRWAAALASSVGALGVYVSRMAP
jgi:hypothetical protein